TSRELSNDIHIPVVTVGGRAVKEHLPWLYSLYLKEFRDIAQSLTTENVQTAQDDRYAINLNVQCGNQMRYECHVDSNPIEGLLYLTDHPAGCGGELVVSQSEDARGTVAISESATRIYPVAGKLVFFDARLHPHFVAPLRLPEDRRIVAAMNYYLPSCPESARPSDLNRHLGLE
ncbi:MAG: 2OG-Fe(II) oxygenase, partial [Pirellula sp.]